MATRTYKDLDFDFTAHPVTGDVARKTGDAAIIQSLKGLLSTGAYERLWQPRIHSRLQEHLFEPIDTITGSAIEAEIRTTISQFEPRVDLIEVNASPDYDSNGYNVTMSFFIVNRTNPITITFFLERIR
jgi:phage baseplate assembly protein W